MEYRSVEAVVVYGFIGREEVRFITRCLHLDNDLCISFAYIPLLTAVWRIRWKCMSRGLAVDVMCCCDLVVVFCAIWVCDFLWGGVVGIFGSCKGQIGLLLLEKYAIVLGGLQCHMEILLMTLENSSPH